MHKCRKLLHATLQEIGMIAFVILLTPAAAYSLSDNHDILLPGGLHYSSQRGVFASAGILCCKYEGSGAIKVIDLKSVYGILLDTTVGPNDYSYSIGIGTGLDLPGKLSLVGGAIQATILTGRQRNPSYFLKHNQKAYGVEVSFAFLMGLRMGLFKIENTDQTKFITSVGFGF